ncbi:patatin-like phospholipase family protein [Rubellimicrobium rubrum]|uniref:Patatin-like phospholipase family protein n=1 Tax=Rubellimicrobium rubrum TaxID=2585369 RepID=A0A5C4MSG2_9RHOB|nr:patatin-like phospholipase family protein [Rubellimicrobium rubrum]TNC48503.1 patatin-like phospholipase family protein [Rubellimicrobium rubrum]
MLRRELIEGFRTALVLGGGNALGAYHQGVCQAVLPRVEPDWFVGCSIGAVTAAILLGNPPETRLDRLREFWAETRQTDAPWIGLMPREVRARWSNLFGLHALLAGRPGLSHLRLPGLLSALPFMPPDVSLQDHGPLAAMLDRLVDWGRVNDGTVRMSLLALDIERGEEVWWDNRHDSITAQHVLAATALPPLFPPVELDGRRLWDGGLANNLPLDRVLAGELKDPWLVIASDLYSPEGDSPKSLDGSLTRAQDLGFAFQSRKRVEGLARERALWRRADPEAPSAVLAHVVHHPPAHQRSLKALDFSRSSLAQRAAQGRADAEAMLARLAQAPRDEPLAVLSNLQA